MGRQGMGREREKESDEEEGRRWRRVEEERSVSRRQEAREGQADGNLGCVYRSQGDFNKVIKYHTQRLAI